MNQDAVTLLCNLTMMAAARIVHVRGLSPDADELTEALKITIKSNLDRILSEWKEGTDANIGDKWLGVMMGTQATELAMIALGIKGE